MVISDFTQYHTNLVSLIIIHNREFFFILGDYGKTGRPSYDSKRLVPPGVNSDVTESAWTLRSATLIMTTLSLVEEQKTL